MVGLREVYFLSSSFKLHVGEGSSILPSVPEVDEVPFLDIFTVLDVLVEVGVSSTNKVSVGVG